MDWVEDGVEAGWDGGTAVRPLGGCWRCASPFVSCCYRLAEPAPLFTQADIFVKKYVGLRIFERCLPPKSRYGGEGVHM